MKRKGWVGLWSHHTPSNNRNNKKGFTKLHLNFIYLFTFYKRVAKHRGLLFFFFGGGEGKGE